MKNKITFFVALTIILISCNKKHPCDYDFPNHVENSSITVDFKDKNTNQFLFLSPSSFYKYKIDTLKILNSIGEKLHLSFGEQAIFDSSQNKIVSYWRVSFGPIFDYRTDSAAFLSPICNDFIVKYNFKESDTLTTCFKAIPTDCGSKFEFLKIYYKGKLVDSFFNETYCLIKHYKY